MKKFVALILLFISVTQGAYANQPPAGFGAACAAVSIPGNINTFLQETSYGYMQSFINANSAINFPPASAISAAAPLSTLCSNTLLALDICLYNDAKNPTCDFVTFDVGDSKTIGSISTNPTLTNDPFLRNVSLTASLSNINAQGTAATLCLTMPTSYGQAPLVCKQVTLTAAQAASASCVSANNACVGVNYSQSIFNFTGGAIECVTDVMNNIFFDSTRCPANETSYLSSLKAFSGFQKALQNTVLALLTMYVMFFGMSVILNQDKFSLDMVVKFLLKFMLVAYFSVGLGASYFNSQGQNTIHNGMIDWGLPILRETMNDFTQMVFQAAGARNLCVFNGPYPAGAESYALWDIVDCRLGAVLGVKSVFNLGSFLRDPNFTEKNPPNYTGSIPLATGAPPLIPALDPGTTSTPEFGIPAIILLLMLGGNFLAGLSILMFLIIFVSIIVGFISVYVVCFISMHALVYLAPVFVPLALFEKTNGYFTSWLKIIFSYALQPMIFGGFVAIMLTMYDDMLFGPEISAYNTVQGCEFVPHQYTYNGTTNGVAYAQSYNTFEMVLPAGDPSGCAKNIGYQIVAYMLGTGASNINLFIILLPQIQDTLDITANAMMLMIFSVIFYFFSSTLYDFSADITGGISTSGVALNVAQKAVSGAEALGKMAINLALKGGKAVASKAKGGDKKDDKGKGGGGKRDGGASGAPKEGGGSGGAPKEQKK